MGCYPTTPEAAVLAPALEGFLLEALAPLRPPTAASFCSARTRLEELNGVLPQCNEALVTMAQLFAEEISLRQRSEAELRESKDHYLQLFEQAQAMEESLHDLSGAGAPRPGGGPQSASAANSTRRASRRLHRPSMSPSPC